MDEIITAVSSVGFPIVAFFVLCYYIFKTQTKLIESINEIATALKLLTERSVDNDE